MRRPLSPHLGIYRLQMTSGLSALHRITGIKLTLLLSFFFAYIGLAFINPALFDECQRHVRGWPWQCLWVLYCTLFTYHMLNGVRHIRWDMGHGYDLKSVEKTGTIVLSLSGFVMVLAIACILHRHGVL